MNQILDYTPNRKGGGGAKSDNIVRFLAVIMLVFALCFIGSGVYNVIKTKEEEKLMAQNEATKANIEVEQLDSKAVIRVTHDKVIEKLIYSWDDGKERSEKGEGNSTSMEKTIELPAGEHILYVKVVDINGDETLFEKSMTSENGVDILSPVITVDVTEEKRLKITATDETKIDFITYRWNDEEEVRIESKDSSSKKIETEIEILKGKNDITIVAVDSNNNTATETKSFTGLTKPEMQVGLSPNKDAIDVFAKHDNGIREIKCNFNGDDLTVNIGDGTPSELSFSLPLVVGYNRIIIKAISVDGTDTEFDGECEYNPETE